MSRKQLQLSHEVIVIDPALATAIRSTKVPSLSVGPDELAAIAKKWFSLDVANGDAQPDTIKTYIYHFKKWVEWCIDCGVNPGTATEDNVTEYRRWLVDKGASSQTIQLKLVIMRRFYHSANRNGLISFNPVIDVKPASHGRPAKKRCGGFTKKEAYELLTRIPEDTLKSMRDRAMIALMMLDGLLRVSVMRASTQDLENVVTGHGSKILVNGKGKDCYQVKLNRQTYRFLKDYLKARGPVDSDELGEPLIATVNKWGATGQKRIGRSAISKEMKKLFQELKP